MKRTASRLTQLTVRQSLAERNTRSLKNIIYKHLENKWPYHYIIELQSFVNTINSRVNRMMRLAPNQVTKKHVAKLISLRAEFSSKQVRQPHFKIGDEIRIAKQDLPFKKGYKQNFTDEVFRITKVATFNSPTYSLSDGDREDISGKFLNRS